MTLASDQKLDLDKLSPTSRRILALREAVLAEWEKRVRVAFQEASRLRSPVFIDTIPAFYDNIAEALTPSYPRSSGLEGSTLATAHGGQRARLTNYDPQDLILEYQILRVSILHVAEKEGVKLDTSELIVLNTSIDEAIREAVAAFSSVISSLREQFVAALTHDLRTPLNAASISAELITHLTDPARTKRLAEGIMLHLARMDKMIQDLLDAMVFQTGERLHLDLSEFDMLEVVREVCEQSMQVADPKQCQIVGGSVHGWWGREPMKRVIENLVGNAVKYGAANTPIRIKIAEIKGSLALSVHNEGPPIPLEEQQSVFQVFRRAGDVQESKRKGWGVGLPYVRSVVESHGGAVTIDSGAGRGTTFTITMPVDSRPFQGSPTTAN